VERLRAAELVIHAGDFSTAGAYEEIAEICDELVAVHGNVDDAALRARLPERAEVDVEGVRVGVIHDAGPRRGRLARLRRWFPDADAVIFGHSHMPLHETAVEPDGRRFQIFNPGSPTERRRAPHKTMGVALVGARGIEFHHQAL
jgi:putative phosphoesterase